MDGDAGHENAPGIRPSRFQFFLERPGRGKVVIDLGHRPEPVDEKIRVDIDDPAVPAIFPLQAADQIGREGMGTNHQIRVPRFQQHLHFPQKKPIVEEISLLCLPVFYREDMIQPAVKVREFFDAKQIKEGDEPFQKPVTFGKDIDDLYAARHFPGDLRLQAAGHMMVARRYL